MSLGRSSYDVEFPSDDLVEAIHQLDPDSVPSGPFDCNMKQNDHILLLVYSDSESYLEKVTDFLAAGLQNPTIREMCTISIPSYLTRDSVVERLIESYPTIDQSRQEIISWDETQDICIDEGSFSREKDKEWIAGRAEKAKNQNSNFIRAVSADTTQYINWIRNPEEYLKWEYYLEYDFNREASGLPFVQVCLYHPNKIDEGPHVSRRDIVLSLISSHEKLIAITENDRILYSSEAISYALDQIGIDKMPTKFKVARTLKTLSPL